MFVVAAMFVGNACGLAGIGVLVLLIMGLRALARRNRRTATICLGLTALLLLGGIALLLDWDRTMRELDRRQRSLPTTAPTTQDQRE